MLGFLERQRLVKRGMASSKLRRRRTENELFQTLEYGPWTRGIILGAFVVALASVMHCPTLEQPLERVLISLFIFLTSIAQLWVNHPHTWSRNSRLGLVLVTLIAHLLLIKSVIGLADAQLTLTAVVPDGAMSGLEKKQLWMLAMPFSFAPLILSVLLGRNHGLFAATYCSLWGAFFFKDLDPKFLILSLISGFVAVFVTLEVRRRHQIARAGMFIGLSTWMLAIVVGWIGPFIWDAPEATHWEMIGWQSATVVGAAVLTGIIVTGIVPLAEWAFGITTDMSWLELADLNHPLLKRMMIEAPGTYQHSLMVATLAEAASESVGANAALTRVGAYFHDIGKLIKPEYFVENVRHDRNPHDDLAPTMSALIIIAHVKEGVDIALKHHLKPEIIDIIQQHHGTSMVYYFYKRAVTMQEEARLRAGGDDDEETPEVREESFRYSGPRPQSREAAIVMLADTIESAARSLERITPQKLESLVDDLIGKKMADGQLRECELTMRDLEEIAENFKHTLQNMMHSRVAYPDQKTGERSDRSDRGDRSDRTPHPKSLPSTNL